MIPYKGNVDSNLIIPGLLWCNEDMLFQVILDNKYEERVTCTARYPGHISFGNDYIMDE